MSHVIADPENMKVAPSPPAPQSRRIIAMGPRGVSRLMGPRQPRQISWLSGTDKGTAKGLPHTLDACRRGLES